MKHTSIHSKMLPDWQKKMKSSNKDFNASRSTKQIKFEHTKKEKAYVKLK